MFAKFAAVLLAILLVPSILSAQSNSLSSPNGQLQISFSVLREGHAKKPTGLRCCVPGQARARSFSFGDGRSGSGSAGHECRNCLFDRPPEVDETYTVPAGKSNPVRNFYNAISIELHEPGNVGRTFSIEARAYDDGVAFRYLVPDQRVLKCCTW